jgi:hypothetical protein
MLVFNFLLNLFQKIEIKKLNNINYILGNKMSVINANTIDTTDNSYYNYEADVNKIKVKKNNLKKILFSPSTINLYKKKHVTTFAELKLDGFTDQEAARYIYNNYESDECKKWSGFYYDFKNKNGGNDSFYNTLGIN